MAAITFNHFNDAIVLGCTAGGVYQENFKFNQGWRGSGWLEAHLVFDLDNDDVTFKWRDLDDSAWGYESGSSWNDYGSIIKPGASYTGGVGTIRLYMDAQLYPGPAPSGILDNVNIPADGSPPEPAAGIPEPATLGLLLLGGLALLRRRR